VNSTRSGGIGTVSKKNFMLNLQNCCGISCVSNGNDSIAVSNIVETQNVFLFFQNGKYSEPHGKQKSG
jgi:hypothetical protein